MAKTPERNGRVEDAAETPLFSSGTLTPLSSTQDAIVEATHSKRLKTLLIELPLLSTQEEETFEPVGCQPDSIVGEYKEDGKRSLFALFDTIAYRIPYAEAKDMWPNKVDDYLTKKELGELEPFNPRSSMVHPASRPRKSATQESSNSTARKLRPRISSLRKPKPISEDESEDDDDAAFNPKTRFRDRNDEDDELDYYEISEDDIPVRRSKRDAAAKGNAKIKQTTLNFDRVNSTRQTRRSNRQVIISSDEDQEDEEEEDFGVTRQAENQKAPRPKVHKPLVPGYGIVHADGYDYDLDTKGREDLMREHFIHRDICGFCHELPAHEQLRELGDKGRKRSTEKDRLRGLGGWVRCLKCCAAFHWTCCGEPQRDDMLRAIRAKEESKRRRSLGEDETTDCICGPCSRGSDCMICCKVAVAKLKLPPATDLEAKGKPAKQEVTDRLVMGESANTSVVKQDSPKPSEPKGDSITALNSKKELTKSPGDKGENKEGPESTDSMEKKEREAFIVDDSEPERERESPAQRSATSAAPSETPSPAPLAVDRLVFRCLDCKRAAHYDCLPPEGFSGTKKELVEHYQERWTCHECQSYVYKVDSILAWQPSPADAPQPEEEDVRYHSNLPRKYLVKWRTRGYNRCEWVSHTWLLANAKTILRHFIEKGSRVPLLEKHIPLDSARVSSHSSRAQSISELVGEDADAASATGVPEASDEVWRASFRADAEADRRIPPAWKTVDRILDVKFWVLKQKHEKRKGRKSNRMVLDSEEEHHDDMDVDIDPELEKQLLAARDEGIEPNKDWIEDAKERHERTGEPVSMKDIHLVAWIYIKWDELPYEQATWDAPPKKLSKGWKAFEVAFRRWLQARSVVQPVMTRKMLEVRKRDVKAEMFDHFEKAPDLGQDKKYKLLPFQLEGVSWLYGQWTQNRSCILADEMGLGKTIQMVTVIGQLAKQWAATPSLVVVPKSTVTNWLREFERWAPNLVVAPYFGEKISRSLMRDHEVFHPDYRKTKDITGVKFHVLVTTYETITQGNNMGDVFKKIPRWELLVVDEGQKLKNDESLIFKKLKELNSSQRVIMTGTPLNNNLRELFNLMNFLDDQEWSDLGKLEKDYQELTERSIAELHERLKPYFLRRLKIDVLKLPPKNEVIVPVSMTSLQKEVYRHILSNSMDAINSLMQSKAKGKKTPAKKSLNNTLIQLRKCLQHPYLVNQDLERAGLSPEETQKQLVDASAKLRLLQSLLPKLRARGHRVLLFSQFKIALDIVDDFLVAEGYKFLRLDGDTPHQERQKGMDDFNKPNSEYFMYLLTTRAGGVGINLSTADTVIIFDPDFNPHQDLQAIARSYRYGLERTCLVFKLMVRGSVEERIMQIAKKKLVLDHLIVQKMDDEDPAEDLQSILTYGAQALFDSEQDVSDITYSDVDLDKLIERTATEIQVKEKDAAAQEASNQALKFDYAKLWIVDRNALEEVKDSQELEADSWAELLAKAKAEAAKALSSEILGRGSRRRAAVQSAAQTRLMQDNLRSPDKKKKARKRTPQSDDAGDVDYAASEAHSSSDGSAGIIDDLMELNGLLPSVAPRESANIHDLKPNQAPSEAHPKPPGFSKLPNPSPTPLDFHAASPRPTAPPTATGYHALNTGLSKPLAISSTITPYKSYGVPGRPAQITVPGPVPIPSTASLLRQGYNAWKSEDRLKKRPSDHSEPEVTSNTTGGPSLVQSQRPHKIPRVAAPQTQPRSIISTIQGTSVSSAPQITQTSRLNTFNVHESHVTSLSGISPNVGEDSRLAAEEKEWVEYRNRILTETGDETAKQQQRALKLIDKKLRRIRSQITQNNQVVPTQGSSIASQKTSSDGTANLPSISIASSVGSSQPPKAAQNRAARSVSGSLCLLCQQPWHAFQKCPLVLAGPHSIKKLIEQLKDDPLNYGSILMLRQIREKQKKGLGIK